MNVRSKLNYLLGFLISVLLFPVLLVVSIQLTAFDESFYVNQYNKLNTAETIGISQDDLSQVTAELLDYIKGKRSSLDNIQAQINGSIREVFNDREKAHMVDVKDLFGFASRVRNISIISILLLSVILYFNGKDNPISYFARSYLVAAAALLALLIIMVPLIQSNFTYYWDQFHYLFFDNDLWILNPETDIMIQMVPEPFFNQAVIRVISLFTGGCFLIGVFSVWILRHQLQKLTR